jgi:hypothetical protein
MLAKHFARLSGWFWTLYFLSHCPANQHTLTHTLVSTYHLCTLYIQFLAMIQYNINIHEKYHRTFNAV